jgi:hypothetical protein
MTVESCRKCAGWFGDIEGVLTAHPVVKGDHVVQPVGVSRCRKPMAHEITAGALDAFVMMEAKAGTLDGFMMEADAGDLLLKSKATPAARVASHGGSQNWRQEEEGGQGFSPSRRCSLMSGSREAAGSLS